MDEIKELGADKPAPEYSPMPDAYAPPEEEKKIHDGNETDAIRGAADELTETREAAELPIVERKYTTMVDGEDDGKRRPDHETVDINRAVRDLDRQRNLEATQAAESDKNVVTHIVDAIRGAQQPDVQQPQQQVEEPQAQPEAQPPTDEQMLQAALERPAVRQALEAQLNTVEQQRAQYAKAAGEAFDLAHASLFAQYPELQNVSGGNLPAVLNVLRHNNPTRYADVVNALQQVDKLHSAATAAKAQQSQIAEAQQKLWVAAEEKKFDQVLMKEPPEIVDAVKRNGARILAESYGVTVDELKEAFAANPVLRSAPMQAALFDLIKTKLTQESLAQKRAPANLPPVMRPGVSRPAPSHDDEEAKSALARFKADPNPKSAAEYLSLKRAAASRK